MAKNHTPRIRKDGTPCDPRTRPAKPTQRLLTGKQIEDEYGIPYRSVYELHVTGKLPAVRFVEGRHGRLWFRRSDIDALIAGSLQRKESA